MKIKELFEEDELNVPTEGGYGEKKQKDKTKMVSKLLRRKADKNNPKDGSKEELTINSDKELTEPELVGNQSPLG